jgi:hypothetical protein
MLKFDMSELFKVVANEIVLSNIGAKKIFHCQPYASNDAELRRIVGGSNVDFGYLSFENEEDAALNKESLLVAIHYFANLNSFDKDLVKFTQFAFDFKLGLAELSSFILTNDTGRISAVISLRSVPPRITAAKFDKFLGTDVFYFRLQLVLLLSKI